MGKDHPEIAAVVANYAPKGQIIKIDGMDVYTIGAKDAHMTVIIVYDTDGDNDNTRQLADNLADHDYRIVIPDIFRGNADAHKTITDDEVMKDFKSVQKALMADGAEHTGLIGLGWGGHMAAHLLEDHTFEAAALLYPDHFEVDDAEKIKSPLLLLNDKDDSKDHYDSIVAVLNKKNFGHHVKHHRWDDVHHGFFGAKADFADTHVCQRAKDSIQEVHDFFAENLGSHHDHDHEH